MIFPIIQFARKVRRRLSDIEYLCAVEFGAISSASITTSSVNFTGTGVKAIVTPAVGKFGYVMKAYVQGTSVGDPKGSEGSYTAQLRNNTSVIETVKDKTMLVLK